MKKQKGKIGPEIIITSPLESEPRPQQEEVKCHLDENCLGPPPFKAKYEDIDPFSHQISPGFIDVLKIVVMSLTLAPLRLFCILILLVWGWCLAKLGLCGLSEEDYSKSPFVGWRGKLQSHEKKILRLVFYCMGFHKINVIGRKVSII